ncbi:MAG TPA: hypothetical protein VF179_01425 [Thermoanaerobaculia bacterium]|nr:hypothetical protein [Thermoanaerobaculia bacterium]
MKIRSLFLLALLLSIPLQAQLVPAGSELRVDTGDDRNPIHVDVSMAPDGSYLVVWAYYQDYFSFNCSPGAIYGRHFDREGRPAAPPFVVARLAGSCVEDLRLGPLVNGRRLLVWRNAYGKLVYSPDLRVASIDSSGRATRVKRTFSTDNTAAVIPLRSGNLLAVYNKPWSKETTVRAERFDALGRPMGKPFLIARDPGEIYGVDAAETLGSDLAVTWISYDGATSSSALLARTLRANGNPTRGIFQVNGELVSDSSHPRIESEASGGFAITWSSGARVRAKLYQPDGTPRSPELNLTPEGSYHNLEDAALGEGEVLAVWSTPREAQDHLPADDIGASLLETSAQHLDIKEPLSEETEGLQRRSGVSTDGKGLWAVAWAGDGSEGRGIYTRLFTSQP